MKKLILIFSLIVSISTFAGNPPDNSGDVWKHFVYGEGAFKIFNSMVNEDVPIRQDVSPYSYYGRSSGNINSNLNRFSGGAKYELFNTEYKMGVSIGLRYVSFKSEITGHSSPGSDFFYFRYYVSDTEIKFARVKSVSEFYRFFTIPVELRFNPLQYRKFGLFIIAGSEFYKLGIDQEFDIEFDQDLMNEYKTDVIAAIDNNLNNSYSTFYASLGIKIGDINKPNLMFEFILPGFILTDENFALMDSDFFGGFRIALQIPINY